MGQITNWDDRIDSRDVLTRITDLEHERDTWNEEGQESTWSDDCPSEAKELGLLIQLVSDMRQIGGDTPEDGVFLVRESHWVDYVEEMYMDRMEPEQVKLMEDLPWKYIDWPHVAEDLRSDYTSVDFDGVTYYGR